ncbi:uncharacterized protein LOC135397462 [Ornithodoros turicata]|uniref:uncharacterized protein LOC135397462 n=1 Tax=Ornithodoros turicata TaxID=34597 RepID=UPI003138CEFD
MGFKKSEYRKKFKRVPSEKLIAISSENARYRSDRRLRECRHEPIDWDSEGFDSESEDSEFLPPTKLHLRRLELTGNTRRPASGTTSSSRGSSPCGHIRIQKDRAVQTERTSSAVRYSRYTQTDSAELLRQRLHEGRTEPGMLILLSNNHTEIKKNGTECLVSLSSDVIRAVLHGEFCHFCLLSLPQLFHPRNAYSPPNKCLRLGTITDRRHQCYPRESPFELFGKAEIVDTLAAKRTFNIAASTDEVHPSALLAASRRRPQTPSPIHRNAPRSPLSRPDRQRWITEYNEKYK